MQTHLCPAWKLCNSDLHGVDAADQEAKRKAKLKPKLVALHKTAKNKLDHLNKRLFELPLLAGLDLKFHEKTAWINVATLAVWHAKAEATNKIHRTQ
jgi:hypothetical protein